VGLLETGEGDDPAEIHQIFRVLVYASGSDHGLENIHLDTLRRNE